MPPQLHRARETFGKQVWLSRKGAIDATTGTLGLIPGSMGVTSVAGKGNRFALNSSPHGAGRAYGRKTAVRTFTRAQLERPWTASNGGTPTLPGRDPGRLQEPIDQVMADAADLVEVRHTLRQIINVKGE